MKKVIIPPLLQSATPAEIVQLRFEALQRGDFGFIHDSSHPASPFRRNFPQREDYVAFGVATLASRMRPRQCRVLDERRPESGRAELILVFCFEVDGVAQWLFELGLFLQTPAGWRYHSGQKLTREEYAGPVEALTFADFDEAPRPITF